jgi:hypothetical protein
MKIFAFGHFSGLLEPLEQTARPERRRPRSL